MKDLGTILGIWAHPDDETWGSAGVMAMAVQNGQRVACVTATKGEAGKTADESRWPSSQLGDIRTKELQTSLNILGVEEHYWLDYEDGKLDRAEANTAVSKIAQIITKVHPDTIISFGSDGLTGHSDHKTICEWACKAAKKAQTKAVVLGVCEVSEKYERIGKECSQRFSIYFKTKRPRTIPKQQADLYIELPQEILEIKLRAFKAQPSQTSQYFLQADDAATITQLLASECFIRVS